VRLVLHKGEQGGAGAGGEHSHVLVVVHHHPSHSLHRPWSSIVVVDIHCHCHVASSLSACLHCCDHCQVLLSMPKVAEGKGVRWQWLVGVIMAAGYALGMVGGFKKFFRKVTDR